MTKDMLEENFEPSKASSYYDKFGREVPDPTPMAPPLGYVRQKSLAEQIREMVVSEQLRVAAEGSGFETFEEADDFEVGDDYDPSSPYEGQFETPVSELVTRAQQEAAQGGDEPPAAPPKKKGAPPPTPLEEAVEAASQPPKP